MGEYRPRSRNMHHSKRPPSRLSRLLRLKLSLRRGNHPTASLANTSTCSEDESAVESVIRPPPSSRLHNFEEPVVASQSAKDLQGTACGSSRTLMTRITTGDVSLTMRTVLQHWSTYKEVVNSGLAGCQFCFAIAESLHEPNRKDEVEEYKVIFLADHIHIREWNLGESFGTFELLQSREEYARDNIFGRDVFETAEQALLDLAPFWIRTCDENHEACGRGRGHRREANPPLPTRVLELSDQGQDVCLRDSLGLSGRYTILTHCWGKAQPLITSQENLDQRKNGIAYNSLPATFRDAVTTTRLLGVKYLWIDSLCIIQNSQHPSDWVNESSKMLQYYRNAYVTLSAIDSKDSHAGFLHTRKPEDRIMRELNGGVFFRPARPEAQKSYVFHHSVLDSRAWCMQERLLSSRILHFGKFELFWECQSDSKQESSSLEDIEMDHYDGNQSHTMKRSLSRLANSSKIDALTTWYSIVEQYSKRDLTYSKDILPAISAIADEIAQVTHYTYIYGIWKEDLIRGLLWMKNEQVETGKHRRHTGAPSWSWAGTTDKVMHSWLDPFEYSKHQSTLILLESGQTLRLFGNCVDVQIQGSGRLPVKGVGPSDWHRCVASSANGGTEMLNIRLDSNKRPLNSYKTCKIVQLLKYSESHNLLDETDRMETNFLLIVLCNISERKWRRAGVGTTERSKLFDSGNWEEIYLV